MLMRALGSRYLVLPFAALLLLFSGGAAAVQDCHIESVNHIAPVNPNHIHADHSHAHTHENRTSSTSATKSQNFNLEFCFAVGFMVLLIFRFAHLKLILNKLIAFEFPKIRAVVVNINRPWLSNFTHLQLGIIRV